MTTGMARAERANSIVTLMKLMELLLPLRQINAQRPFHGLVGTHEMIVYFHLSHLLAQLPAKRSETLQIVIAQVFRIDQNLLAGIFQVAKLRPFRKGEVDLFRSQNVK